MLLCADPQSSRILFEKCKNLEEQAGNEYGLAIGISNKTHFPNLRN